MADSADMDPVVARKMHRTLEPYHGLVYLVPEAADAYARHRVARGAHGLLRVACRADGAGGRRRGDRDVLQLSTRPRALGHSAGLVARECRRDLGGAPGAGRHRAASHPGRRRPARVRTSSKPNNLRGSRPKVARRRADRFTPAMRHLDYPDEPHLALWHSLSLLREFRGDGHIAALVVTEHDGCDAIVMHHASGEIPRRFLATRAWSDAEWAASEEKLRGSRLARRRQCHHRRRTRVAAVGRGPDGSVGVAVLGTPRRRTAASASAPSYDRCRSRSPKWGSKRCARPAWVREFNELLHLKQIQPCRPARRPGHFAAGDGRRRRRPGSGIRRRARRSRASPRPGSTRSRPSAQPSRP